MLSKAIVAIAAAQAVAAYVTAQTPLSPLGSLADTQLHTSGPCKQFNILVPKQTGIANALESLYNTPSFKTKTNDALSAIIRVPSVSSENFLPVGQDPHWETFSDLHTELRKLFPLVFKSLNVTTVNTYNLVFHWQGSDDSLKPVLLTAHQDVVPVEPSTVDQWTHPPFSGYNDGVLVLCIPTQNISSLSILAIGTWIWGRGSVDDKPDIISQLTAVDSLLKHGFKPKRSFVLAFGIDEESSGTYGARHIYKYLEGVFGQDSFAALIDEGSGFSEDSGIIFAGPAIDEKGYLDVRVEVRTPGGHSSVPPRHTAIGILAQAITAIEANPHPTDLLRDSTTFQYLQCAAEFSPSLNPLIRELTKRAEHDDNALKELAHALVTQPGEQGAFALALLGTTQAVDLISGGVKVNALPEKVEAVVNHRISEYSSVSDLQSRFTSIVLPVAERFNLTLDAFGRVVFEGAEGRGEIVLSDAWGTALEPAPKTPTNEKTDGDVRPYELLQGTIKAALKASPAYKDKKVVSSPALALGNTDTKSYWNLTRHIFRYGHLPDDAMYNGAHTVNEAIHVNALVEKVRFHSKLILNWSEADF
ncbi:carboxypeptidase S [Irpex rosettiformis]|uniref:Carboxypeptidase S n=1 Tax=Irpex rosettiformis TaxID=378272 RepID=A0ACB8UCD0_9APHY|nr:carboxypeptidase S [Irpex rosettiformis]